MYIFRDQGDISNIYKFSRYGWVYARDRSQLFPQFSEVLGRYLGPVNDEGNKKMQ